MLHKTLSYAQRAEYSFHALGKQLLLLMEEKESNLAVSADLTQAAQVLELAESVGPEISVFKTHVDILKDFTADFAHRLCDIARKHRFLIFEDRKFADIGNTVKLQYQGGIYQISDWADLTNAHILPGPGVIEGLKEVGLMKRRALLLLAEMSAQGNLATGNYTQTAIQWAEEHADFVIGFICLRKLSENPGMIHFTPGVHLSSSGDSLKQKYLTPSDVIAKNRSDVMIVGRGIVLAPDPLAEAKRYRQAGWEAYQSLLQ